MFRRLLVPPLSALSGVQIPDFDTDEFREKTEALKALEPLLSFSLLPAGLRVLRRVMRLENPSLYAHPVARRAGRFRRGCWGFR